MKLDSKDIEAVAKGRVVRDEKQRGMWWMVGAILGIIVGYFVVVQSDSPFGFAICGLGVVAFLYYSNTLSKKQNALKTKLLKEWKDEQGKVVK